MKSELRLAPHLSIPGAVVVEIWHDGTFIGSVYGADGPGVRVVTKHRIVVDRTAIDVSVQSGAGAVGDVTVWIGR